MKWQQCRKRFRKRVVFGQGSDERAVLYRFRAQTRMLLNGRGAYAEKSYLHRVGGEPFNLARHIHVGEVQFHRTYFPRVWHSHLTEMLQALSLELKVLQLPMDTPPI
ncbi:MAG TPA: hypothetical protein VGG19_00455 [Tepidisphaeraceae bacterium]|jgi:hypothetical protein